MHWGASLFSLDVKEDGLVRHYKSRLLVLITVLTGLLMWTYSLISLFFVEQPILARIGYLLSDPRLFAARVSLHPLYGGRSL